MKTKKVKNPGKRKHKKDDADAGADAAVEGAEKVQSDALSGAVPLKSVSGLSKTTRKALLERGFSTLLEVQHRAFQPIFSGKDTVGRAKTGCGKTLAFCLPVVERIVADALSDGKQGRKPLMVGLAPTRELAKQILVELKSITEVHNLKCTCLYGGTAFGPQCDEIRAGLDLVIATPGRLLDHLKRGTLSLDAARFVVMDEADEMLSMGFQEDVETILSYIPSSAQKMLFSATMPKWVQSLIAKHLQKDCVTVDVVGTGNNNQANANITHQCISCSPFERGDTLADLCKAHAGTFGKTLVFAETKKDCDELAKHPTLIQMGAGVLHGDIPQTSREVTMDNFRTGKIRLLLATDVAARGLDVPHVDLVVMTRPPGDLDTYVHRSGRTGRAGRSGTCVVFYTRNEEYLIRLLQHKKGIPLKRRGPPQPCEVVEQAARDCVRQIDQIHQDNVDAFAKVAEELLSERGSAVYLLSAALAAMTGYTARIKCRSLLSSFEGHVAMLIESEREIEATSKAWYLLRNHVPQEVSSASRAMQLVKGKHAAIFDCPQEHQETVLKAPSWKGIKFSVAKELPELETHPNQGASVEDDLRKQRDWRAKKWEKIKGAKARESSDRQDRAQWQGNDSHGTKRKHDDVDGSGAGRGSSAGRGFGGRGKGKGKGSTSGASSGGTGRGYKAARTE
jgi:ATP-dependent RNA helicase DDX21